MGERQKRKYPNVSHLIFKCIYLISFMFRLNLDKKLKTPVSGIQTNSSGKASLKVSVSVLYSLFFQCWIFFNVRVLGGFSPSKKLSFPPGFKELEISDQEPSPSAGKSTGVVLVPCCTWKCVPTAISASVDISKVPGCHLLQQMSFHWGS